MFTLPPYPPLFWPTAVFVMLIIGISKAGLGGGIGAIATPLLALFIPVADAAALLLPILIVADLLSMQHYRQQFDRESLQVLLPSGLVGIVLGSLFFNYFRGNEQLLKTGIGIIALLFVLFQLSRALILRSLTGTRPSTAVGLLLGTVAGFTSTLAHVGGPPATIYLLPQKLPRNLFVGTTVVFFMVVNIVKLIPYAFLGLLRVGNIGTTLLLLPLTFVGVRLGVWLNGRLNETLFNGIVYALLTLTSIELIFGFNLVQLLF